MKSCPICSTSTTAMRDGTPYWTCSGCGLWFQDPMPPKLYQHPEEYDLAGMPEGDKAINRALGKWLFEFAMRSKPGRTLDIGAKHPVMARELLDLGCEAWAMDAEQPPDDMGVKFIVGDFERDEIPGPFDLVTMVHVFEHAYDPVAFLRKVRSLMRNDDSRFYIRLPDNSVPGIERDLNAQHYAIHPFVHCLSSLAELCARTEVFVIEWQSELRPGQRDLVLRPVYA